MFNNPLFINLSFSIIYQLWSIYQLEVDSWTNCHVFPNQGPTNDSKNGNASTPLRSPATHCDRCRLSGRRRTYFFHGKRWQQQALGSKKNFFWVSSEGEKWQSQIPWLLRFVESSYQFLCTHYDCMMVLLPITWRCSHCFLRASGTEHGTNEGAMRWNSQHLN